MTKSEREKYKKCIEDAHGMCEICGKPGEVIHHVYGGPNRDKSTQYGMLAYLCVECHETVHSNYDVRDELRATKREKFRKEYPDLDFFSIFRRNC